MQCFDVLRGLKKVSGFQGSRDAMLRGGTSCPAVQVPHHERLWECPKGQEADCGDGMVSGSEECDAGKDIAGCSKCNVLPGWSCDSTGSCSPLCGDGKVEGNEICDDGTDNPWGGCSNDCQYRTHLSYSTLLADIGGEMH